MKDESVQSVPVFTIVHRAEIDAAPNVVWGVLVDFERYHEWNPYVLAISGNPAVGATLDVTIKQRNWVEPLVIRPVVASIDFGRKFHWRGIVGDGGLLDTDHSFELQPIGTDRTAFVQSEEFRGEWAGNMTEADKGHTQDAFRAMNEGLASRSSAVK